MCTSCDYFKNQKVDAQTLYEQEIKTIDWNEVDTYPELVGCASVIEKQESKICFEQKLSRHVGNAVKTHTFKTIVPLQDTILVQFTITEKAAVQIKKVTMDTTVKKRFPKLALWIEEGIDSVNLVAPAYKRGVPVKTQFTLPIILNTQ